MKNLMRACLIALSAGLMAIVGAGTASATTLEIGGVTQNGPVAIVASLASGTSLLLKDSAGTTTDTCSTSEFKGATESPYTNNTYVGGALSTLTFGGCSHTTHVIKAGSIELDWDGGTNGTVFLTNTEVLFYSTAFGVSAICKAGAGIHVGTLTGVSTGHAIILLASKISCGVLGTSTLTGSYTVTSPTGLGVEG
jgi:hypothetical protein